MGQMLPAILGILNLLITFLQGLKAQRERDKVEEGIRKQQEGINEAAARQAQDIEELVNSSDLSTLRERMRKYERP